MKDGLIRRLKCCFKNDTLNSKLPPTMDETMILLQLKNCMPSGHFSPNTLLITLFYFQIPYSLFPVAFINSLYTWEYYYLYIASFFK